MEDNSSYEFFLTGFLLVLFVAIFKIVGFNGLSAYIAIAITFFISFAIVVHYVGKIRQQYEYTIENLKKCSKSHEDEKNLLRTQLESINDEVILLDPKSSHLNEDIGKMQTLVQYQNKNKYEFERNH